jgi:hypothetical protein
VYEILIIILLATFEGSSVNRLNENSNGVHLFVLILNVDIMKLKKNSRVQKISKA